MYKSTDFFWNSAAKIIVMQIEGFQIRQGDYRLNGIFNVIIAGVKID